MWTEPGVQVGGRGELASGGAQVVSGGEGGVIDVVRVRLAVRASRGPGTQEPHRALGAHPAPARRGDGGVATCAVQRRAERGFVAAWSLLRQQVSDGGEVQST